MSTLRANESADCPVDARAIMRCVSETVRLFDPARVILFGSYAYGRPTANSDVDLLIVMSRRGPGYRLATEARLSVTANCLADLMVRSDAELRKQAGANDFFIIDILEKGIVLHDRANPDTSEKGQSRLQRRFVPSASSHSRLL
jgi:predicted nucleotidyltransferase